MSQCDSQACRKRVAALEQLLEKQNQTHTAEVKKIQQSLSEFATVKNQECQNYQVLLDKMTLKIDKYKAKCCTLSEKVKQSADTIKALNNQIAAMEDALRNCREEKHREKCIGVEQARLGSELRQVIALQEAENKELSLRVRLYEQQLESLQSELALKTINEAKLKNADNVSEDQYQREVALLRQNLKLEFSRTTDELLSTLVRSGLQLGQERVQKDQQASRAEEDLRILANFTDYGVSFLDMNTQLQVTLEQSTKVYSFIKRISRSNLELVRQMEDLQQSRDELKEQMRSKLADIEQLVAIQQVQTFDAATQTPSSDSIEKLTSINGFYRLKLIEFQQIISLLVHFCAYAYQLINYNHSKIRYYQRAANGKLRSVQKKPKHRLRSVALCILFIQHCKKIAGRSIRNRSVHNIDNPVLEDMLKGFLAQRDNYNRKNPVLQRLLRQKARVTSEAIHQNFVSLVSEQIIGVVLSKYNAFTGNHYDINFF